MKKAKRKAKSTEDVIDAFGGNKAFARVAQVSPQAVHNWRKTGSFPANSYLLITSCARAFGIRVPSKLFPMRTRRRR